MCTRINIVFPNWIIIIRNNSFPFAHFSQFFLFSFIHFCISSIPQMKIISIVISLFYFIVVALFSLFFSIFFVEICNEIHFLFSLDFIFFFWNWKRDFFTPPPPLLLQKKKRIYCIAISSIVIHSISFVRRNDDNKNRVFFFFFLRFYCLNRDERK